MDDINEFPNSWVELYNNSDNIENLSDYKINVADDVNDAWQLPDLLIHPKEFVLVYCDKTTEINREKYSISSFHTPFQLESGKGCSLYLFKNDKIIDYVNNLGKQPSPNISYGREKDGATQWGYQLIPSPGRPNLEGVCDGNMILKDPEFSINGFVKSDDEPILLTLTVPNGSPLGTIIRYTLDGKEPTDSSAIYITPLNICSTTVVRAKLFCQGWLSPRSTVNSYIFYSRKPNLSVVSLVTDSDYFYDSKKGIYVEGNYRDGEKNYSYNWRRPVNVEYFEVREGGASSINQLCETRIMGGASRDWYLKSMVLYANKRFGKKRFEYEFFPEQKPGLKEFKSIILRNGGNDFKYLHMRDAIIQQSVGLNVDLDWQAYLPVVLFINGQYKGIINLRERSNEDYVWSNYERLEDIDLIENLIELKEGDLENYNEFVQFYSEKGHKLSEYEKWMDCDEYINLMVMNIFYNNMDFPGNNIVMWRPRSDKGRWRFIAKDTDMGLGLYWWPSPSGYKTLEWLYNPDYDSVRNSTNKEEHTRLFRHLMEDDDFKRSFIDKICIFLGDFLREDCLNNLIDKMYNQIKDENYYHLKENNILVDYEKELSDMREWIHERIDSLYDHISSFYNMGDVIPLQIHNNTSLEDIIFNGVKLKTGYFNGKFYSGRRINLESNVSGWRVICNYDNYREESVVNGSCCTIDIPDSCKSIDITTKSNNTVVDNKVNDQICIQKDGKGVYVFGITKGSSILVYDISGRELLNKRADSNKVYLPNILGEFLIFKIGDQVFKVVN